MSDCMTQEDAMNMSDEQAVQILKPFRDMMIDQNGCPISDAVFALDKAIVALSKKMPTVEERKGKWIEVEPKGVWTSVYHCSECGGAVLSCKVDLPKYCGHCGADMRGETDG